MITNASLRTVARGEGKGAAKRSWGCGLNQKYSHTATAANLEQARVFQSVKEEKKLFVREFPCEGE
jgi:hypothetical protein